jgi:predicted helicase
MNTPLENILKHYTDASQSQREKGTYFEYLIQDYLRNEPQYRNLYSDVWTYKEYALKFGADGRDTGIDLVARTRDNQFHAIQCKFYATHFKIPKSDIDSFFTASGKTQFSQRIIVHTTNHWSDNAYNSFADQHPPVSLISLYHLQNSQIDWSKYDVEKRNIALKPKKSLRDHQKNALNAVVSKFDTADRGKLIMACGTGKTFTSLKIAETLAGKDKKVLFLVPSLSLLSQTLTEWTHESDTPLSCFAVCSDASIGKKDAIAEYEIKTHELNYPATTNAQGLAVHVNKTHSSDAMTVFSTYHSIEVISKAQKNYDLSEFDLIICDEAHRTTGATFADDIESAFVRIHDNDFIAGKKRLYMTATPKIYGNLAKAKSESDGVTLCSMDDEALYGETLFTINFSEAVERELLTDYKVIILTVDEKHISDRMQGLLADDDNQLNMDDAAKIVGCWKALSKQNQDADLSDDINPMTKAVAFAQVIEPTGKNAKAHKVSSKQISRMFQKVVEEYQRTDPDSQQYDLKCEVDHIDGSMNASTKEGKLQWLKEQTDKNICRILSNVRCLSEGVDVPSLDAVLFLTPRNSQIDVVQSVGRIMRNAPNKKRGYVILPVVIPSGIEPHKALDDNKTYKVVWEVLQALRSHDDNFDSNINKMDLEGFHNSKIEIISIVDDIAKKFNKDKQSEADKAKNSSNIGKAESRHNDNSDLQDSLKFSVGEIEKAILAKIVKKCGTRFYWENWAGDIADIARKHIIRIQSIVEHVDNNLERTAFNNFCDELRDDLNPSIHNNDVIEMLAQHLITKPVFEALFSGYNFASQNPVSKAMQNIIDLLETHNINQEAQTLERFYHSVKLRASGIDSDKAKQKIIVELYDKFFKNAFPRLTEKLGIVYTPVEVVDFIIHSVNDVLQSEFNQTLGSSGVHILDPFTGTGTFITRLLQSGLITKDELEHKYKHEIHANEIVLLAYYIAAINIESTYHGIMQGDYEPFNGICLTDTFQLYESEDMISQLLVDNSTRRQKQKSLDIRVIMGNPPYSAGQKSENDNAKNISYPKLDESIRNSYAKYSKATNKNALYDSYIRAIKWGSDQLKQCGVMAYVSGSAWIERSFADGLRKTLAEEFSNIYVFHLRGDIRKNMLSKGRAGEGENIFDSGSMTGIAISIMVKNPQAKTHGNIYYHDIGNDLKLKQKQDIITNFKSINGITNADKWQTITPNESFDWIAQRDYSFDKYIEMGNKKDKKAVSIFESYSRGVMSCRDVWVYNYSKEKLTDNMQSMIGFYNSQVDDFTENKATFEKSFDTTKISWDGTLNSDLEKKKKGFFDKEKIVVSNYRPYLKQYSYYDRMFNNSIYLMPSLFPNNHLENKVICISGVGARSGFSVFISDKLTDLELIEKGQNFSLYLYEPKKQLAENSDLFDKTTQASLETEYTRNDGISDAGLRHFFASYPSETITKEDIFYYIYGLLHSSEYREKFADNLSKQLPRIPCVAGTQNFWEFVNAGRKLGELHLNYETITPFDAKLNVDITSLSDADFYVTKMKHGKDEIGNKDLSTIIYNHKITISNIPPQAYEYIVNGKPAIQWVMERQGVRTDKDSGIVNDANLYALETVNDAKYPLMLLLRVITVSLETNKIVGGLPSLGL